MRVWVWSAGVMLAAWPALACAQRAPAPDTGGHAAGQSGGASAEDSNDDYADPGDIVVTGRVPPGQVVGDVQPELQLGPADVRAYGVDSISDLIDELAPETQSARGSGPPAILLNGKRISSFHEIRDLPTEAILRVDILPEQVALEYGFSADQKVVNIVLRRHFRSTTIQLNDKVATEGGTATPRARLGVVNITPTGRFNLNLDYQQTSKLLESERDVTGKPLDGAFDLVGNITPARGASEIDPALSAIAGEPVTIAGVPASAAGGAPSLADFAATANQANVSDLSPYRTLIPWSRDFSANAVYARTIFGNVSATVNGRLEYTDSKDDLGLPGVALSLPAGNPFSPFSDAVTLNRYVDPGMPLQQSSQSIDTHLGMTFNGSAAKWNWNVTGNYDRTDSKTFTDRSIGASALQAAIDAGDPAVNPFGPLAPPLIGPGASNFARSISNSGEINALVNGSPFSLPAGKVQTSWHVGVSTSDFTSRSIRSGVAQSGDVSRDIVEGRFNLDVPIASRARAILQPLGDFSLNLNLAAHHLSDFGTLERIGYGFNWAPLEAVRTVVSWTDKHDAPTAQQLGNPVVSTPNRRVFDYVAGRTVDITRISGGNPNLAADTKHVFEAELNVKPFADKDLRLIATYTATRTDNPIANLPAPTAAIEAAFPDRFVRGPGGDLVSIDARPVNFDEERVKTFRWGFNFSAPLKSKLQKEMAAYRNGEGPNPYAGLRRRRRDDAAPTDATAAPGRDHETGQSQSGGQSDKPASGNSGEHRAGNDGNEARGFRGFGRRGGRGGGGGRIQVSVYHTWRLEDQVRLRGGLPVLDLLHGDTTGTGGGEPRHQVQGRLGYFNNGLGAQLRVNWQSGTHVNGGTPAAPELLTFSSLATFNLRLFADLGNQMHFAAKHPWARGLRITLSANNLLDSRQRVTDATGATPISYQPDYLDPLGRTVMISIRKLFFQRSAR
ncbi:MAG TPA: TonB-dependent receptor [Sphingomonas sp.]|nr:TonB-dependent receptor [Sphingomonas sp.]